MVDDDPIQDSDEADDAETSAQIKSSSMSLLRMCWQSFQVLFKILELDSICLCKFWNSLASEDWKSELVLLQIPQIQNGTTRRCTAVAVYHGYDLMVVCR